MSVSPSVITFRLFHPKSQSPMRKCQTEPNQINRNLDLYPHLSAYVTIFFHCLKVLNLTQVVRKERSARESRSLCEEE